MFFYWSQVYKFDFIFNLCDYVIVIKEAEYD